MVDSSQAGLSGKEARKAVLAAIDGKAPDLANAVLGWKGPGGGPGWIDKAMDELSAVGAIDFNPSSKLWERGPCVYDETEAICEARRIGRLLEDLGEDGEASKKPPEALGEGKPFDGKLFRRGLDDQYSGAMVLAAIDGEHAGLAAVGRRTGRKYDAEAISLTTAIGAARRARKAALEIGRLLEGLQLSEEVESARREALDEAMNCERGLAHILGHLLVQADDDNAAAGA